MAAVLHTDSRECDRRLSRYFNSTRAQWIEVAKAMVAARGSCTGHNPKASPGYFAWDAGITRMRQLFCREGWAADDDNGIELIINRELRKRITVMNADHGVCDPNRSPRNRTEKGAANEKITDLNSQLDLFRKEHPTGVKDGALDLWQFCLFDDGKSVLAELSRPIEFKSKYYVGYSERIWILRPGEWERIAIDQAQDDGDGETYKIDIRRK